MISSAPACHRLARSSSPRSRGEVGAARGRHPAHHLGRGEVLAGRRGPPRCPGRARASARGRRPRSRPGPPRPASRSGPLPGGTGRRRRRGASPTRRAGAGSRRRCRPGPGAPRGTRTGGRGSVSVRSRSPPMPYMICSSNGRLRSPPLTASRMKAKYSIASQSKPRRYSDAEHERRVPDPGVPVVPVARPAGRFRQRGRRGGHDGAGGGVAEPFQRQRAAVEVGLPRMVGDLAPCSASRARSRRCVSSAPNASSWLAGHAGPPRTGRRTPTGPAVERGAAVAAGAQHAERDAARQLEPQVSLCAGRRVMESYPSPW